jgi:CRISPR system Cascade subunit CasD
MPHTLLLLLCGPMQAWGSRSRFEDRDTHPEPTKSGVLGLVCAALGPDGPGRDKPMDDLNALRFGVRVERPGHPQTDYQTAQQVRTADGNIKDTVLSTRHYLADARFLVGFAGDDLTLLRQIEAALKNPCWTLSLGRKSYPLTLPPYLPNEPCKGSMREGIDLKDALKDEPWWYLTEREGRYRDGGFRDTRPRNPDERPVEMPREMRLLLESADGTDTFLDTPLHFGDRRFGVRRVHIRTLTGGDRPKPEAHPCCISQN